MDGPSGILIAAASQLECRAVLDAFNGGPEPAAVGARVPVAEGTEVLLCGVGPAPAAVSAALAVADLAPALVLNAGIAGAYATGSPAGPGDSVLASASIMADHGLETPQGFRTLESMGFPPEPNENWTRPDPAVFAALRTQCDHAGIVATVSTASGTERRAAELASRTGAVAEAMEGAAVALACSRLGCSFVEWRVISNTVGDRSLHPWRIDDALDRLRRTLPSVVETARSALHIR